MRNLPVLLASVVACLSLWGCGSSGSNDDGPSGPGDPGETTEVSYTFAATTKYVSQENEASIKSVEEDGTIVVSGDSELVNSVAEGDILVFGITSKTPNGLLRKVTSKDGVHDVTFQTEAATLPEAFEDLDLIVERSLPYVDLDSYETVLNGLELRRHPLSFEGSAGDTYQIDFNGTVLFDLDGSGATTDDQIVADGSIAFTLGLTLEVETSWLSLERVKVGVSVSEEAALAISTNLSVIEFDEELVVAELYFGAFAVGPVIITPNLELVLGTNGELKAQVSTSVAQSIEIGAGAVYQNKSWTPYSGFSSDWNFEAPTVSASARVKAYVGPRVNLLIYGVAGPYAQIDGYLELEADLNEEPWWNLYAGIEAFIGIKGEIFGYELLNYQSGDLLDYREVIAQAETSGECVPDCDGLDCGDGGCQGQIDACGTCGEGDACSEGVCVEEICEPNCAGKECGSDGCGGTCGDCSGQEHCVEGTCGSQQNWSIQTGDAILSSPAIGDDGFVFIGSRDGFLYRIDPGGAIAWKFEAGLSIDSSPAIGSDGTIYFGTFNSDSPFNGTVYAVSSSGSELWALDMDGQIISSPAVDENDNIYIGCGNKSLYKINKSGSVLWSFQTDGAIVGDAAIGVDGTIYFGSKDHWFYALSEMGELLWKYDTGFWIRGSPAIGEDGTIYIGGKYQPLFAFNLDGSLKWEFDISGAGVDGSPAIGKDGTIYVGTKDDYVYAINGDGSLKWKFATEDWIRGSPAIGSDGTVFIPSEDDLLYAFNPDGSLKWTFEIDGGYIGAPAIGSNGTLYLGSWGARVYAIDTTSVGLATSAWPRKGCDNKNTGKMN